jgi:hypothetical protein
LGYFFVVNPATLFLSCIHLSCFLCVSFALLFVCVAIVVRAAGVVAVSNDCGSGGNRA